MKTKNIKIIIIILIFFLSTAFFIINYLSWKNFYKQRIYPQTFVANLNLDGKTLNETQEIINKKIQKIEKQGLIFQYKSKKVSLAIRAVSFDADLSYSLLNFDVQKIALEAYGNPAQRTFKNYLLKKFKLIRSKKIRILYTLNQEKIKKLLANSFPELDINPSNAYFSLDNKKNSNFELKTNSEQIGIEIDYKKTIANLKKNLDNLDLKINFIKTNSKYPKITQKDLIPLIPQAEKIISGGDLILKTNISSTKYWEVNPQRIITWISAQAINKQTKLVLNQEKIKDYLKTHLSPLTDQAAIKPVFKINDGKVSYWRNGKNGKQLDLIASAEQINSDFLQGKNISTLLIRETPADNLDNKNGLDIKEIIGIGESNFKHSSPNRIHNIKVGVSKLQGVLIKPQEEFSLIKALGEINNKTGYRQELVIKDNKTIPEYGGGLCQIATTIFRTALASGLPITERQNHSYRVSYYEPAGKDATIYDPQPDLRFINDTKHYILIQARIIKTKLYFDFWGTSDGRIATTTFPVIYNIIKPKPTKIIKTNTLKPGEKKCTESSHTGADAFFDYTITYSKNSTSTNPYKRRFYSHYAPWQAVCLVGEEEKLNSQTASSTFIKN